MPENSITVIGNLTRVPELTFLDSGQAKVRLGVAVNRSWKNKATQEWEERTSFFDVTAFGTLAENAANSLDKGHRVIVHGTLEQRSWENDAGEKRSAVEIKAEDVAPSLRFNTALISSPERSAEEPF